MNKMIIDNYIRKIDSSIVEKTDCIANWRYRTAIYESPEHYNMLSDWKPLMSIIPIEVGTTVFTETEYTLPEQHYDKEECKDYLFIKVDGFEGLLTINGQPYHGTDANHNRIPVPESLRGKKVKIGLELYSPKRYGISGIKPLCIQSEYIIVNKYIEKYYFDIKIVWESIPLIDNEHVRAKVNKAIDESLRYLDLSVEREEYIRMVIDADKKLCEGLNIIGTQNLNGNMIFVGHSHIDTAWLWQLKESVRKCGRTFFNILSLMDQYHEFKFSCSQPQLYEYTKRYYPELFEQIKKRVAEGRWEIIGPMWVEPDCNVTSGESLVRQLLYGKTFFEREFGITSNVCWLPDTFGFQASMPQILKKSGIDLFVTFKINWQCQNRFPYTVFKWRGIDGTEIISTIPKLQSFYNGFPSPEQIKYADDENVQKDTLDYVLFPYGNGDGGGGPTYEMVEFAKRMEKSFGLPSGKFGTCEDYFNVAANVKDNLPVWFGELYLETHRGTYTTEGKIKKLNRKCEQLLRQTEIINMFAQKNGLNVVWDKLSEEWRKLLVLQFHDILPGSSIREVYEDAENIYSQIALNSEKMLNSALSYVLDGAAGTNGNTIIVFNSLSWLRTDIVTVDVSSIGSDVGISLYDDEEKPVEFTLCKNEGQKLLLMFIAEGIPSIGYRTYYLRFPNIKGEKKTSLPDGENRFSKVSCYGERFSISNSRYIVEIDSNGTLNRLYDCANKREVIAEGSKANEYKLFLDGPQKEDAWNLYSDYKDRQVSVEWKNKIYIKENNSLRTVVCVYKNSEKITVNQEIIMYRSLARIDFNTEIDWNERNKVLKAVFPLNVMSPYATYEIGFGAIERPTYPSNPWEVSKFEVSGHRWVDISEGDYGISLLNDCKYGYDIEGSTLSITLLRGTGYPDHLADIGKHSFVYSIFPHSGDWRHGETVKRAYELNSPVVTAVRFYDTKYEENYKRVNKASLLTINSKNVILEALKPSEDGNGIIMRVYESNGNREVTSVEFGFDIKSVYECNLMERNEKVIEVKDNSFSFKVKPFEIKTFSIIS